MTPALFAALAGLALLDSINPSAIVAVIFLMTQPRFGPRLVAYVGGVFATYLAAGLLILAGLDAAWSYVDSRAGYIVQAVLGAALLGYAVFAPSKAKDPGDARQVAEQLPLIMVAVMGAGVTLVEFSTALPYLAAIALLSDAHLPWVVQALVLVVYNAVFVTPPLLLGVAYLTLGERVRPRFERWGARLQAGARSALLWLLGLAGVLLLRNGLVMLIDFGAINLPGLG